jgi:hypothetical protein
LCCQPDKAILEKVGLQWLKASHYDIDPEVILVPTETMRVREVLGNQIAISLVDGVFLADNLDSPSATRRGWLQDVHVFEVVHFSIIHPPFVVFWEDVSCRGYLIVFSMLTPLLLDISPHVCL